ncbi:hypothetical protein [Thioalkalivibrio sp. ALJ16]|uniref:hypothetical protein n=1 Tax=Thioalkalivibrio sp. ALJ16 TaxID=1158762 RepID=UPI0004775BEF|nr:hypothetical protein [Thioalkalivibrio sp. ALJ16]
MNRPKPRSFTPERDPMIPSGPASQYLTKNRGRPSDQPKAQNPQRVKIPRAARKVARASILAKLSTAPLAFTGESGEQWLGLAEIGLVLGLDVAEVADQHARGEGPPLEMRKNEQGHHELMGSVTNLTLYLITEATR